MTKKMNSFRNLSLSRPYVVKYPVVAWKVAFQTSKECINYFGDWYIGKLAYHSLRGKGHTIYKNAKTKIKINKSLIFIIMEQGQACLTWQ